MNNYGINGLDALMQERGQVFFGVLLEAAVNINAVRVVREIPEGRLVVEGKVFDILNGYFVRAEFDNHATILHGDGFLSTGILVDSQARLPLG